MCGLAIYTRREHFKEHLLQKLFPEVVYFQKSSAHAIFLGTLKMFFMGLLNGATGYTQTFVGKCRCMCY